MARVVRQEKGLEERIPFKVLKTRGIDNPYYKIVPSGRVPALVFDDGTILEESAHICWYFDHIDGAPRFHPPEGLEGVAHRRLEATARSLLDGLSLWGRELIYRDEAIWSETLLTHERARALRLMDFFERKVHDPVMTGPLNMAQITLASALHGRPMGQPPGFDWQEGHPNLVAWVTRIGEVQSIADSSIPAPL